jgi:hypothetical protein
MVTELEAEVGSVGEEFFDRSLFPFTSASGLLLEAIGVFAFVGVVISIGSPGEGAEVLIVGVGIGMIRVLIGSSGPSEGRGFRCGLSIAVAI